MIGRETAAAGEITANRLAWLECQHCLFVATSSLQSPNLRCLAVTMC